MKILIDMDEVVVDLLGKWGDAYNKLYNDCVTHKYLFRDWDCHNRAKCGNKIYDIIKQPGFFEDLPAKEGAIEYIRSMEDPYLITSCSKCGEIAKGKFIWVEKYMPFFDRDNLIITNKKSMVAGDVLIDDREKHLFYHPCKHKLLMDSYHNQHCTDYKRVYNWKEIMDELSMLQV